MRTRCSGPRLSLWEKVAEQMEPLGSNVPVLDRTGLLICQTNVCVDGTALNRSPRNTPFVVVSLRHSAGIEISMLPTLKVESLRIEKSVHSID